MARHKDVIDESAEWRLRPLSLAALLLAGGLATMIAYNAFAHHPLGSKRMAEETSTTPEPQAAAKTIVIKYDPVVQETQRQLANLGIYKGQINGVRDEATKQAITSFQNQTGLPATGEASGDLLEKIKFTGKVQAAAASTGSVNPAAAQQLGTAPIYSQQLEAKAKEQLERVKQAQIALASQGYDVKTIDGKVSAEMRSAILKFEMENGLDMNGAVDDALLAALKAR